MLDFSKYLEKKLLGIFPDESIRKSALTELQRYGTESYEREIDRVRLSILKLAGNDLKELKRMVETAKQDYRDVLAWAEYPRELRSSFKLSEEEKKKIREEDLKDFTTWLVEE